MHCEKYFLSLEGSVCQLVTLASAQTLTECLQSEAIEGQVCVGHLHMSFSSCCRAIVKNIRFNSMDFGFPNCLDVMPSNVFSFEVISGLFKDS